MKTYLNSKLMVPVEAYQEMLPLKFESEVRDIFEKIAKNVIEVRKNQNMPSGDIQGKNKIIHELIDNIHELFDNLEQAINNMVNFYQPILHGFFSHDKLTLESLESHISSHKSSTDEWRRHLFSQSVLIEADKLNGKVCNAVIALKSFQQVRFRNLGKLKWCLSQCHPEFDDKEGLIQDSESELLPKPKKDWNSILNKMNNLEVLITKITEVDSRSDIDALVVASEFTHFEQLPIIVLASIKLLENHGFLTEEKFKEITDSPYEAVKIVLEKSSYFQKLEDDQSLEIDVFRLIDTIINMALLAYTESDRELAVTEVLPIIMHYGKDELFLDMDGSCEKLCQQIKSSLDERLSSLLEAKNEARIPRKN